MKRLLVVLLMTLVSGECGAKVKDEDCGAYLLWREARAEGILTQRAVMDVVIHRAQDGGMSICKVAFQPGQFPYMAKGLGRVNKRFLVRYRFVMSMPPVLPKKYVFFNSVPHEFGRRTKRIGRLYFAQ